MGVFTGKVIEEGNGTTRNTEEGIVISTNGTATKHQDEIEQAIRDSIKLGIGDAISSFGLLDPKLYRAIVESSDFFHNPKFPWNQTALPEHYGAGLRY